MGGSPTQAQSASVIGLRSLPRRQIIITVAGVMIAMFLSSLDQTIVSTAMPRIIADLGGFTHYTWITTAYLVSSTVVLPITGKLTDIYGRKMFFIGGITIFIGSSLFAGLSQTMTQIIIFRGLQGLGAGIMMANALTVVGDLFTPAERGKYQGIISAVFGVSAIIGPALGGFITDAFSWHWIFFINVPLGVATIIMSVIYFPNFRMDNLKHRIDYAGITALVLAVVPLLLALSWGGVEYSWGSAPVISMFALSLVSIGLLPVIESRAQEPIIPLSIFRNPVVAVSIPVVFLSGFGMFGSIIFVPLFFQGVMGLSATASGGFLTPMTLAQVFGSFTSGQMLARAGGHYRVQGIIGLGLMVVGLGLLSRMTPQTSYAMAIFNVILVGIGLGITLPLYTIIVQNAVPYNILGAATASVPFFRSLGGTAGLAIFGSIVTNRFASQFMADLPAATKAVIPQGLLSSVTQNAQALVSPEAQNQLQAAFNQIGPQGAALYQQTLHLLRQALAAGLSEVFLIAAIITLLTFVINLFLKEIPLRKAHVMAEPQENGNKKPE
ncbi:MAG: MDR family MFS transporter [Dehalococcoidales bacterium]|nr:MDR family MFS transporter [Dehalococcoidales bacterium]